MASNSRKTATPRANQVAAPVPRPVQVPLLTELEFEFFKRIAAGEEIVAAFKATHECGHWAPNRVLRAALELRNSDKIESCLEAAQEASAGAGTVSKEQHVKNLDRIRAKAERKGNYVVALNAEIARGRVAGHYVERTEHNVIFDPVQVLKRMAAIDPDGAKIIARKYNVDWAKIIPPDNHPKLAPIAPRFAADDIETIDTSTDDTTDGDAISSDGVFVDPTHNGDATQLPVTESTVDLYVNSSDDDDAPF